jgi:hypothetical protein
LAIKPRAQWGYDFQEWIQTSSREEIENDMIDEEDANVQVEDDDGGSSSENSHTSSEDQD